MVTRVLVRAQKEVKRTEEKGSVILEITYIIMNRVAREMNIKIATDEALEGNDEHFDTGKKVICVIKWQKLS